jgi:electron transfer flavoprotein alpha subunit
MTQEIIVLLEHNQGKITELSFSMLAAGRNIAEITNSELSALLFGHNLASIETNLSANKLLCMDHPSLENFAQDAFQQALAEVINKRKPLLVILGNTTMGSDIAGGLSIQLGLELINSCKEFTSDGHFISQICGGKILVEGEIPKNTTTLVTMIPGGNKPDEGKGETKPPVETLVPPEFSNLSISTKEIIKPSESDVDISTEDILISVGRGIQIQDNIELAEDLAAALGGYVCASRPIIDQGWLPLNRLVGKSGKQVNPKLYLALGISGAPEHTEAITSSETIIAINTDPSAPIFSLATYGTETDLFDLVEVLIDKIEEAKSS